ncbi:structural constituent of cytoskeleton [Scheffersomyces amazonensis]|uniref:structural constituent of cytoskeleton n=1 Tax=Scheffersomyces amazonensis TaxID=1078765 RepID=UPI00315CC4DD
MSRAEVDLQISVKKACNTDEVPPKRKHVRACIVYTWDHKNSRAFWNAVKIQPLQSSEIQLFKALIMIHKVLQEGHPNTLKDAYRNRDFLSSLSNVFPSHGSGSYGRLINQYDRFILQKLDFHRNNPGFNGMFEYEEYISLRAVNDPNEGYESILQLMDLQDVINDFQKLIFATINQTPNNLCKVSALVPLITESYGIYKFCTSMLRAMYQQLGEDEALQGLFERFDSQHYMLRDFYTDCHAIKFLTSLITIPRLGNSPPNLQVTDEGTPISRPRSVSSTPQVSSQPTSNFEPPSAPPPDVDQLKSQQTGFLFQQQQEQQLIQQQLELQRQQQLEQQQLQQRLFEEQQRNQERIFLQEQQQLQAQQTAQHQGRVSELEHDLLMFKNQYDNDQNLLQQYDARVKSLETEMQTFNATATQQVASKDEQIRNLEEQISNWTKKYESLAKLYSQLRQEHLNLLTKFKKIQQKITSAQESILKKEKFEKDLKAKNVELADLIRERDRARLDLDRLKASKDQEIERLQAEVRELNNQANEAGKQSLNLSSLLARHETEKEELKRQLANGSNNESLENKLREKEVELEIAQESLESAMKALELTNKDNEEIVNSQIDQILLKNIDKLKNLIDLFLENNIIRVQDSRHELASTMQAGNLNATPEYVLSIIELTSDTGTDFATIFNSYIASGIQSYDDSDNTYSDIILKSSDLATNAIDLMLNTKGITRIVPKQNEEELLSLVEDVLAKTVGYFASLKSESLNLFDDEDDKIDTVIDSNLYLQNALQELGKFIDGLRSKSGINFSSGNLEEIVDHEMQQTEQTIASASKFLDELLKNPVISGGDIEVHEAILAAAKLIIDSVANLIVAATDSQREIVNKGKGSQSRTEFYKKNNRWTEGLISASKAVAGATNVLIQTADGVLRQTNSHEQLIVASNEVAASTAQLVSASRVKANFVSKTQDHLESASTKVSSACKSLVSKVQSLLAKDESANQNDVDLSKLTPYEGKTIEMEQQVEILKLENKLAAARKRLGEIRKHGYRDDDSDEE